MSAAHRRDIVVVGASAGGVEALSRLVSRLPAGVPAAIFVVLHIPPGVSSRLPEILSRRGALTARNARDRDPIRHGEILVAPPDHHLLLAADECRLHPGPRENSARPAIDPLFRSAAAHHGSRVVGVVLSGYLDDGAEGLRSVVLAGGIGIAQDPNEAVNPEMPANAISRAGVELVLPVDGIADAIIELASGAPAREGGKMPEPEAPELRPERPDIQIGAADTPGIPTGITCPECNGMLWIGPDPGSALYHCRTGHTFSVDTLRQEQHMAVERSLWAAVRSLREQAAVSSNIAARAEARGTEPMARYYRSRERVSIGHAETLERMLTEVPPEPPDFEETAGIR